MAVHDDHIDDPRGGRGWAIATVADAIGMSGVVGSFQRGDPVSVFGPDGAVLGQGLTRYTADEARAIAGKRSDAIAQILGYAGRSVLIHRDDLAL